MKESLQNIRDIIVKPRIGFTRLKDEPKWLLALMLCCISFASIMQVTAPFEIHLASNNTIEKVENINKITTTDRMIEIVSAFVVIPVLIVLLSIFFLAVARLFRVSRNVLKFSYIYAGIVHLVLISVCVWGINTVLLLIFKSPQDIHTELDMRIIPGLHHVGGFLKNENLLVFLSDVNLLSIWEITLSIIAVKVLVELDRPQVIFWGFFIWIVPRGLAAAL